VPQDQPGEFDLTVNDLVQLGRLPHQHMLARTSVKDEMIVAEALELTGVTYLRHRPLNALSGGERQRATLVVDWGRPESRDATPLKRGR